MSGDVFSRIFFEKLSKKKAGKCSLSILCLNPNKIEETPLLSIKQKVPVWYIVFEQMINERSVVYQERIHAFMVLTLSSKHISRYLTTYLPCNCSIYWFCLGNCTNPNEFPIIRA